jgi:hypothetical protein
MTEDREWTWEDISKLMIKIESRPRGAPDKNRIASAVVTVKYFNPSKASPYFYATVDEQGCRTLELKTGIFRIGSPLISSDAVEIMVNENRCDPTPLPTRTFTPIPAPKMVIPTPAPTRDPGLALAGANLFRLSGLRANPDPMTYVGTFLTFSRKKQGDVNINIYSQSTGKVVRQIAVGPSRAGDMLQIFYNGLDDTGKLLPIGKYTFEVVATGSGTKEAANGSFYFTKKK